MLIKPTPVFKAAHFKLLKNCSDTLVNLKMELYIFENITDIMINFNL
jgi:hypothetical protein